MPSFDKRRSISDANKGREFVAERQKKIRKGNEEFKREIARQERADVDRSEKVIAPARIYEPRCNVCQHAFRDWIEVMLIKGMPYKTLGERVSPQVDRRSISNHYKKHMDLQDIAFRQMLEREARLEGLDIEEGVEDIITKRGVLETMVRKGYNDVLNGVTTVEPRDLVQITKLLAEMETRQNQIGLDELRAQVQIFIQAIRDVCDPDMQAAIAERVKLLRSRENIDSPFEKVMDSKPVQAIPEATVVEVE
jgi:hypothetical protein